MKTTPPSAEGFAVLCAELERECAAMGLSVAEKGRNLRMWAGEIDGTLVRVQAMTGGGPDSYWTRAEATWRWPHQYTIGDDIEPHSLEPGSPWNAPGLNDQFLPIGRFWNPPVMAPWQDQGLVENEMWKRVVPEAMVEFRRLIAAPPV